MVQTVLSLGPNLVDVISRPALKAVEYWRPLAAETGEGVESVLVNPTRLLLTGSDSQKNKQ